MNEKLKPCPFCGHPPIEWAPTGLIKCLYSECSSNPESYSRKGWNDRTDGWIEVDGAKNIPIGDWMVATCDKELKVATHIAKCRPNVIVIGGHFHFDMPKVYAYKEIGELPIPPKAVSCGE